MENFPTNNEKPESSEPSQMPAEDITEFKKIIIPPISEEERDQLRTNSPISRHAANGLSASGPNGQAIHTGGKARRGGLGANINN